MANKLPTPATTPEILTHAAVLELQRLNANIEMLIEAIRLANGATATGETEKLSKPKHRDGKRGD